MERPTIDFVLPKTGFKVVMKEYLTGRERRQVKNALFGTSNFEVKGKDVTSDKIPFTNTDASSDKSIELMVVSIDGRTENVLDIVLDELPDEDYDMVMAKIEEHTKGVDDEKKAEPSPPTAS